MIITMASIKNETMLKRCQNLAAGRPERQYNTALNKLRSQTMREELRTLLAARQCQAKT
jgi:hypothetical protein